MATSAKSSLQPLMGPPPQSEPFVPNRALGHKGALIINADDWGLDRETTDRIRECAAKHVISSASGMVFMADSERAAALAREQSIDIGLHLNLTQEFSGQNVSAQLREHHKRVASFLIRHRLAQIVYHPGLAGSFKYVVSAQLEEFHRIYGEAPRRIDGHHHMHLCANVLFANLLPAGTIARRSFSFTASEKGLVNRMYRGLVDIVLARRHDISDFFYSLIPIDAPGRLARILGLARDFVVEVETHPAQPNEHAFLTNGDIFRVANGIQVEGRYSLRDASVGTTGPVLS